MPTARAEGVAGFAVEERRRIPTACPVAAAVSRRTGARSTNEVSRIPETLGPGSSAHSDLAALAHLSEHLNRPLDVPALLDGALHILQEHWQAPSAWITIGGKDDEQQLAAHVGLPPALAANGESALRWSPCRCQAALLRGELKAWPRVFACDRLELASGDTAGLRFHASVALKASDRVVGLLHVVRASEQALSEREANWLAAASHVLGMAVERAQIAASGQPVAQQQEQRQMLNLTSRLLGLLDVDEIMAQTAQIVSESFAAPLVGVYLYDDATRTLALRSGAGWSDAAGARERVSIDEPRDLLALVARSREAQVASSDDPAGIRLPQGALRMGMASGVAAVMQMGDKLVGVLAASSHEPGRFAAEDRRFLASLADQAALALDRADLLAATRRQLRDLATLHERAAEQTRQLSETYGATLAVLGDALELRDQETMGHTQRVVTLAVSLGTSLGLGPEDLLHLQWGAYVHDLGKIGVPDAVLRKPGPLSPDEWRLMQRHPEQGFNLLQRLFFLSRSLDVVRYHHERFDGGGYPLGLKGDEIPLLARIFAVADAFDAMTNDRPYRHALPTEDAMVELRRHSGRQFDPRVVAALEDLPEGLRAAEPASFEDGMAMPLAASGAPPLADGGERLLRFAELCGDVLRARDLPAALDAIAEGVHGLGPTSACAILLQDAPGLGLKVVAQRGFAADAGPFPSGETTVQRALASAEPYYAPDLEQERLQTALGVPARSEFALPLKVDDQTMGVLEVAGKDQDAFSAEHRRTLEAFALLAAFTVQRVRRDDEMERLALTDVVTGLVNRRALDEAAEREVSRAARHGRPLAFLALSLDAYPALCEEDRMLADEALRAAARLMHQSCRKEDVLGRRDGGEFLFILPETSKVGALLVAERLRADIGRLVLEGDHRLGVSVGIATLPDDADSLDALLDAADRAMYKAVRRGGNEVVAASAARPGPAAQD